MNSLSYKTLLQKNDAFPFSFSCRRVCHVAVWAVWFGKRSIVPKSFSSTYSLHCSDLVKVDIPMEIPSRPGQEDLFEHGTLHFQLGRYLFKHLFAMIEIQITSKCVVWEQSPFDICNGVTQGDTRFQVLKWIPGEMSRVACFPQDRISKFQALWGFLRCNLRWIVTLIKASGFLWSSE